MNAILASKRATQTSWHRTFQAQGMNSARRVTELALVLIKSGTAALRRGPALRRALPWKARPAHAGQQDIHQPSHPAAQQDASVR